MPIRIFLLLFLSTKAPVATGDACELLKDSFEKASCYRSGECGLNTFKLLDKMERAGENLDNFDVVFILHQLKIIAGGPRMPTVLPVTLRRPGSQIGFFSSHFFILGKYSGKVFDLDFLPKATPIAEYAQKIFGQSPPGDVVVKRLGARQYLDLLKNRNVQSNDDMGRVAIELKQATPQWPEARLSDVIADYSK